jgi:hypothetical protein
LPLLSLFSRTIQTSAKGFKKVNVDPITNLPAPVSPVTDATTTSPGNTWFDDMLGELASVAAGIEVYRKERTIQQTAPALTPAAPRSNNFLLIAVGLLAVAYFVWE